MDRNWQKKAFAKMDISVAEILPSDPARRICLNKGERLILKNLNNGEQSMWLLSGEISIKAKPDQVLRVYILNENEIRTGYWGFPHDVYKTNGELEFSFDNYWNFSQSRKPVLPEHSCNLDKFYYDNMQTDFNSFLRRCFKEAIDDLPSQSVITKSEWEKIALKEAEVYFKKRGFELKSFFINGFSCVYF